MNPQEALEKLLPSYKRYYNIKTEDVTEPFSAEAEFHSHNEQYILVRSAKIADIDSNEFVFFATPETLSTENFNEFDQKAWETGLSRVKPVSGHKNSDVTLIVLCNSIEEETKKIIKKAKHSKTYMWSLRGWSNYAVIVLQLSDGKMFYNRFGKNFRKIVGKVLSN